MNNVLRVLVCLTGGLGALLALLLAASIATRVFLPVDAHLGVNLLLLTVCVALIALVLVAVLIASIVVDAALTDRELRR